MIFQRAAMGTGTRERIAVRRGGSHGKQDLIKIGGCSHSVALTWRAGPCNCHPPLTEIRAGGFYGKKAGRKKRGCWDVASHVARPTRFSLFDHSAFFPPLSFRCIVLLWERCRILGSGKLPLIQDGQDGNWGSRKSSMVNTLITIMANLTKRFHVNFFVSFRLWHKISDLIKQASLERVKYDKCRKTFEQ